MLAYRNYFGEIMQRTQVLTRRYLALAVLASLAACTTKGVIGDQGALLMKPGHGLVANSVVFQNPNSGQNLKVGHKITILHFTYESIDGEKRTLLVSTGRDSAVIETSAPRSADDDGKPRLMLTSALPGKYRLRDLKVIPYPFNHDFELVARAAPVIEVTAGQVTYAGSNRILTRTRWVGGSLAPAMFVLETVDDFARDVAELKEVEPRLRALAIGNALAR